MSLRVTQSMMHTQLVRNLNSNMLQSGKLNNQLSTGRKINAPSDDPVGITYSLRYRSEISINEQYQTNVDAAASWLDFSDQMIGQVTDVLHRVKDLTVQGSNGTNPQTALDSINSEIKELKSQLVDIGNSQLNGKYVFNGESYDKQPYKVTTASTAVTDPGDVNYAVGTNVTLAINIKGDEIFGTQIEPDHLLKTLDAISTALTAGNTSAVNAQLGNLDSRLEKLVAVRAEVGAKANRVDLTDNRLKDLGVNLTSLQSKTEDADYSELIMKSKINENIYQASLSTGAKIISPTLVDFLR